MLKGLKITGRLGLGFGMLIALISALAGLSVHWAQQTAVAVDSAQSTSVIALGLKDCLLSVRQGRALTWTYIATGDEKYLQGRNAAFAAFKTQIAEVERRILSPEGHRLVDDFRDAVGAFEKSATQLADMKTSGVPTSAPEYTAAFAAVDAAARHYAETNDAAAQFYERKSTEAAGQANDKVGQSITFSIAAGALAVLLGIAAALVIGGQIAKPIQALTAVMGALAAGDLSVTVPASRNNDEIARMTEAVQVFKDNAMQVEALRREQQQTAARAADERQQTMRKMADDFQASVMDVVAVVSASATQLQASAHAMSESAQQTRSEAGTVAAASGQVTANVQTVASAAEQLSSSITEIARQVDEAASISTTASEETARTNALVEGLASTADKIGEVVNLINDIASQTNLLALNATIEAARAGDAGKGFAVVAGEVKNLATQTGRATDEISNQISAVQEETRRAVAAIRNIGGVIDQVRQISSAIASAVEEQGAATKEITRNIQQAAQATQEVSSTIGGVTSTADATGSAAGQVLASAGALSDNAQRLRREVDGFLGGVRAG